MEGGVWERRCVRAYLNDRGTFIANAARVWLSALGKGRDKKLLLLALAVKHGQNLPKKGEREQCTACQPLPLLWCASGGGTEGGWFTLICWPRLRRKGSGTPDTRAISTWFTSTMSLSMRRTGSSASLRQYSARRWRSMRVPFWRSLITLEQRGGSKRES